MPIGCARKERSRSSMMVYKGSYFLHLIVNRHRTSPKCLVFKREPRNRALRDIVAAGTLAHWLAVGRVPGTLQIRAQPRHCSAEQHVAPKTVAVPYARTARCTALKMAFRKISLMSARPSAREPDDFRVVLQLCNIPLAIIPPSRSRILKELLRRTSALRP